MSSALGITLILICPTLLIMCIVYVKSHFNNKNSRAPFDYSNSIRMPGFSLMREVKDIHVDLMSYFLFTTFVIMMPFCLFGLEVLLGNTPSSKSVIFSMIVCSIGVLSFIVKILSLFGKLRNTRLGMEAEWAVASALSEITDPSVRVFHDIQGDNFNIDHVLTYPGGILAIETKGRRKPKTKENKETHKVKVINDKLEFPTYSETNTVAQACRQAQWLTKQLKSSTGMDITARPLVVIPGWFVEMQTKPVVRVMNHKSLIKYYQEPTKTRLSQTDLSRINHQLDLLCRRNTLDF